MDSLLSMDNSSSIRILYIGGFHKWRVLKMVGLFRGKSKNVQWMMTTGTPISGTSISTKHGKMSVDKTMFFDKPLIKPSKTMVFSTDIFGKMMIIDKSWALEVPSDITP